MKKSTTILLLVVISFLIGCTPTIKYDMVINNVGLFDGDIDRGIVNIGIRNDSIISISKEQLNGDFIVDGTAKYLIPGMVNAHVHVSTLEELKESYSFGILANLNMHTGLEKRELEWKKMSKDTVGFPFLFGSGHAATVPNGHPNQFSPDMETINDSISIKQWVDNRLLNNVDYIKIVRDNHSWMGRPPLPTLSYEQIKQIIDYTHSKGYKAVVHAVHADDFLEISKFKPDGFVHMWDYKENAQLKDEDYKKIAESGAFIVPTSGITLKTATMDLPPFFKTFLKENILSANERKDIIKKIYDNGITIIAGTDAQQGQMNFGDDYYYELYLYKQAGLSNLEILKTATGNPAKVFDIPVGTIKEGTKPNMLLISGNPIENLDFIKKIELIWKNGKTE